MSPGEKYYGEAWIFPKTTNAAGGYVGFQILFKDSKGVTGDQYISLYTSGAMFTAGQWTKISGVVTVPANCDQMWPYVYTGDTTPTGNVFYWDDVIIREVTAAQNLQDTVFQTFTNTGLTNTTLTDLVRSLTTIPFGNILGIGGPANLGSSIQSTWDNLISGLVGSFGTGAGLADLFNVGYEVSSNASKGGDSWDILGIRNNKSLDSGLLATSQSNIGLSKIGLSASAPTFAVTSSGYPMAFQRIDEAGTKGVVSWLGSGTANITDFRVNIWKMDPTTGAMTLVHASTNQIGLLSVSMSWYIYTLPTALTVAAAEVYGIEFALAGSGTHSMVGQSTWLPVHPNVFPRSLAALRTTGGVSPALNTVIAAGSVNYPASPNVPFVEFGVTAGTSTQPHSPLTMTYGAGSTTIPIPDWANFVDVIAIGSGGGGGKGGLYGAPAGNGGEAGFWATTTWTRTTHFTSGTIVSINVPTGGNAGLASDGGYTGYNGANTVVSIPGQPAVTALLGHGGSVPGTGWHADSGEGADNLTYRSIVYAGGAASSGTGAAPGGGGASGPDAFGGNGSSGAPGGAWIVFRQS